jgi:thiamine-phosphate pyrophosphorylase
MLILLSHPETLHREPQLVNAILGAHAEALFHFRKPELSEADALNFLQQIEEAHYDRVVMHHHHRLTEKIGLKGSHLTETARKEGSPQIAVSSSFHSLAEARSSGKDYEYFFCSPVFPSISKIGYSCDERWDISGEDELFRKKAVALGGIEPSRAEELKSLGFVNFAVLGAIWYSDDPISAFGRTARALGK